MNEQAHSTVQSSIFWIFGVYSAANFTASVKDESLEITTQPTDLTITEGDNTTFAVRRSAAAHSVINGLLMALQ